MEDFALSHTKITLRFEVYHQKYRLKLRSLHYCNYFVFFVKLTLFLLNAIITLLHLERKSVPTM